MQQLQVAQRGEPIKSKNGNTSDNDKTDSMELVKYKMTNFNLF